jgi:hypothetical protein
VSAALCFSPGPAEGQATPPPRLPPGTPVTFIADDTVNVSAVRPGGRYRVHLDRDLVLDGTIVAPAGTHAVLIVVDKAPASARPALTVAIGEFNVRGGELPVRVIDDIVPAMVAGTLIPARTMGIVEEVDGAVVVRVPLPFALSTDPPTSIFSPLPAKTPPPPTIHARPRSTPSPAPVPSPTDSPRPPDEATLSPAPSPAPS